MFKTGDIVKYKRTYKITYKDYHYKRYVVLSSCSNSVTVREIPDNHNFIDLTMSSSSFELDIKTIRKRKLERCLK